LFIPYISGLIARVWLPTSTVSAGPATVTGGDSVIVALPLFVGSKVLVAVTVTVAGAGYGV
jgi:hypothetical protein